MENLSQPILEAIERAVARTTGGELPDEVLRASFTSNAVSSLAHGATEEQTIESLDKSGVHKLNIPPSSTP